MVGLAPCRGRVPWWQHGCAVAPPLETCEDALAARRQGQGQAGSALPAGGRGGAGLARGGAVGANGGRARCAPGERAAGDRRRRMALRAAAAASGGAALSADLRASDLDRPARARDWRARARAALGSGSTSAESSRRAGPPDGGKVVIPDAQVARGGWSLLMCCAGVGALGLVQSDVRRGIRLWILRRRQWAVVFFLSLRGMSSLSHRHMMRGPDCWSRHEAHIRYMDVAGVVCTA
mmetsp:Transcript_151374/g.367700  ORF Transcript_151374/g.367700 Transcript_151374/m.367700 type:complete len:236 (-) Transcript_151374:2-709(-)